MKNRALHDFMITYLKQGSLPLAIPDNPLRQRAEVTEFVLYREGQFQVEMITVPPRITVAAHSHPNVDTYERFLCQDHGFAWEGKRRFTSQFLHENGHRLSGFIPHGMPHGAFTGDGSVFLSIQHWLNGIAPTFISDDWQAEHEQ